MEAVSTMHRARSYQLEMLEQSLKGNIIVAMDTGSGKTQIAFLRIMEELERCSKDKVTLPPEYLVAIVLKRNAYLAAHSQLPAVRTRLLIGSDNVDRWSDKRLWDAVLSGVQLVVSTHDVLLDALVHGFVQITRLALLIFDEACVTTTHAYCEAHHCRRKHPANRIMQEFYHPSKSQLGPTSVPHVLGLTASPVVNSRIRDLSVIETNLDAMCRTPRRQRDEMLQFVHAPVVERLFYQDHDLTAGSLQSTGLRLLQRICQTVVPDAAAGADQPNIGAPLVSGGYEEQLIKFQRKARHINDELGPWAADHFILESIKTLGESLNVEFPFLLGFKVEEKTKLLRVLQTIPSLMPANAPADGAMLLSPKVERLISFLAQQDPERCSGLVFVKQRAVVGVLHALLSRHPRTAKQFRCATFVGLSNNTKRRYSMAELLDVKAQCEALTELKAQVKNIIIATDVLEEGIDVTACNLVVCFDLPANLKSFLQRRGRARQERSTFAILLPDNGENEDKISVWQQLEQEMIRLYQDDTRSLDHNLAEEPTENVDFEIQVSSTGAKLTADAALGHLHHFCALLPFQPYVNLRPAFAIMEDPLTGLFTATVTLPNCVNASIRCATGCGVWETKKAAVKDAAFQAYKALFHAGMLNDHLLPLQHDAVFGNDTIDALPAMVEVNPQFDPWVELAKTWSNPDLHCANINLRQDGQNAPSDLEFSLITPAHLPSVKPIKMYWSECDTFTLTLGRPCRIAHPKPEILRAMREITELIQQTGHSDHHTHRENDFVSLFTPRMDIEDILQWLESNQGRKPAMDHCRTQPPIACRGFVRTPSSYGRPYIFQRWCVQDSSGPKSAMELECVPLPKRRHFLRPNTLVQGPSLFEMAYNGDALPQVQRLRAQDATVDRLSVEQARFGLFIPGLLQHIEVALVAEKLCTTVLSAVPFTDLGHVISAISCPAAQWVTHYQRLEFIGDSVLKFVVSGQLFVSHPSWHEGYLSWARAKLTSNNTLATAATRAGLDYFILTEPPRATSKQYPRISDRKHSSAEKRHLSSKTLADVVEALIGAAFMEGGFPLSRACMQALLPDMDLELPKLDPRVFSSDGAALTNFIVQAEALVGYEFQNKGLLLESLTHPTCERDIHTESYQRLEFLGDAVLDMLVVSHLAQQNIAQGEMTRIKAAIVNGHLLGFFCLELSTEEEVTDVEEESTRAAQGRGGFRIKVRREHRHLWQYMRFHNQDVVMARDRTLGRYDRLRGEIRSALATGLVYPWVPLTRLSPEKFFSDIIESILGAIFTDAQGDLAPCHHFFEHIGLGQYLQRVLAEHVDVEHPRNALQRVAGSPPVQYSVDHEGEGLNRSYHCTVSQNEEPLVHVIECLTKDEAVAVAAESAKALIVERRNAATADVKSESRKPDSGARS